MEVLLGPLPDGRRSGGDEGLGSRLGSKQTWRRIRLCMHMEPHWESTDGSNTSPASTLLSSYSQVFLVFFLQVQIPCCILSSCATSQVRRVVSLSVVPVQHCCLEEDPSRPTISFPWAVLFVVDSLSLLFVGHSKGKTHESMKRRQAHHTSKSNDFHAALFVDEYPRPSIDVCTIGNSPTLHTNLSEPPLSVQLWVSKLSKRCQHFLKLLVKKKQLWEVKSCLPACLCMGRYLCLEPVLPVAMRFHASCSAVTSALASPMQATNFGGTVDHLWPSSIPWCKKVKNDQKLKSRGGGGPALIKTHWRVAGPGQFWWKSQNLDAIAFLLTVNLQIFGVLKFL